MQKIFCSPLDGLHSIFTLMQKYLLLKARLSQKGKESQNSYNS